MLEILLVIGMVAWRLAARRRGAAGGRPTPPGPIG